MSERTLLWLSVFVALGGAALNACSREDGQPDPPPQVLVPCDRDAGEGDPLACPPGAYPDDAAPTDGGVEDGMVGDGGAGDGVPPDALPSD